MDAYNEIRSFVVQGHDIDVRVDNVFNENGSTGLYTTCPQWNVWNTQAGRLRFPVQRGPFTDPDAAFADAVQATEKGMGT